MMAKELNCLLSLLYLLLFVFTYARVKESIRYETLRDNAELLTAIQEYGYRLGTTASRRALTIWRGLGEVEGDCQIIPPFKTYYPIYAVAGSPLRISSCLIPKNMSTVLSAIMCELYQGIMGNMIETAIKMKRLLCQERNELHNYNQIKKLGHGGPWVNFAMVREPAERFLSGFMFMCKPHCDLHHNLKHFRLIQYSPNDKEKVATDLREVLEEGGVSTERIDQIVSQISSGTTNHATSHLNKTKLYEMEMQDVEVKRLLVKIFYWDYILFNYPLPEVEL